MFAQAKVIIYVTVQIKSALKVEIPSADTKVSEFAVGRLLCVAFVCLSTFAMP